MEVLHEAEKVLQIKPKPIQIFSVKVASAQLKQGQVTFHITASVCPRKRRWMVLWCLIVEECTREHHRNNHLLSNPVLTLHTPSSAPQQGSGRLTFRPWSTRLWVKYHAHNTFLKKLRFYCFVDWGNINAVYDKKSYPVSQIVQLSVHVSF